MKFTGRLSTFLGCSLFMATACIGNSNEAKTHRVLQFENDHVKVWRTVIAPSNNKHLKMHRHEVGRVIVTLKGGTLKKIEKTGEQSDLVFENGKAYWLDADPVGTLHSDTNVGDEPVEVMVIEIKHTDTKGIK